MDKKIGMWRDYNMLRDQEETLQIILYHINTDDEHIRCCGITELDFQDIPTYRLRNLNQEDFEELIAKYMQDRMSCDDNRVFICGIPVHRNVARDGSSMYDMQFYRRLKKTLEKFGALRINQRSYTNSNSKNKLFVYALQRR